MAVGPLGGGFESCAWQGSLTKVEAFASQTWLKIQLLETLAKVGGLDNCSLLVSKQLKVLIMNVVPIN